MKTSTTNSNNIIIHLFRNHFLPHLRPYCCLRQLELHKKFQPSRKFRVDPMHNTSLEGHTYSAITHLFQKEYFGATKLSSTRLQSRASELTLFSFLSCFLNSSRLNSSHELQTYAAAHSRGQQARTYSSKTRNRGLID